MNRDQGSRDESASPQSGQAHDSPPPSVLEEVDRRTDGAPRIVLRDSDAAAEERVVSPRAPSELMPSGRGNYQIHGEIARGGMGQIIRARDTDLGRDVAIKVLDPSLVDRPNVLQRFVEEAQIGGQLQHPGVVPVYEMGLLQDERPFFTMKLVKGRTLSALLSQRQEPTEDRRRFLAIFESVSQTVAYAHSKGVIHRDLKPANIMVGAFGEVLVVDWGLAKVLGQGGVEDEKRARTTHMTVIETVRSGPGSVGSDSVVGSVMGTPAYMSPEQAMGEVARLDERADVFSLGAILCEILTGRPPYGGAEEERTVVQAAQAQLEVARDRIEECQADGELKKLCLQCLAPAPAVRPRNAEEVARKVHDHLAAVEERAQRALLEAAEARVKAEGERHARRLTLGLAAAVVVALVSAGGAVWWTDKQHGERVAGLRSGIDETQAQVVSLQQEGRFGEALEVARGALTLVEESGQEDAQSSERAESLVAEATERVERERERADQRERERVLVARLEELRLRHINTLFDVKRTDLNEDYVAAFEDYGVSMEGGAFLEAVDAFRDSEIASDIVAALDSWSRTRRDLYGWRAPEAQAGTLLAMDLDPDPIHTEIRQATLEADFETLLAYGERAIDEGLGPHMIWNLGTVLYDLGRVSEAQRLIDRGVQKHPDDFTLNIGTGFALMWVDRPDRALPHFQAARALRPNNGYAHLLTGNAYNGLGDYPAALAAHREAARLSPEQEDAHLRVALSLLSLELMDEAVAALERCLELEPDSRPRHIDLMTVRCQRGDMTVAELMPELEALSGPAYSERLAIGYLLVAHPDPEQRDARRAIEHCEGVLSTLPRDLDAWSILVLAARDMDDTGAALELLRRAEPHVAISTAARAYREFAQAQVQQRAGEAREALEAYELGEHATAQLLMDREAEWQGSLLLRLREETRAALGL